MSKRELILQAIFDRMKTVSGVSSSNVFRSRIDPISSGKVPAITVEPTSDVLDNTSIGYVDHKLGVKINLYAKGQIPDSVADTIIESIQNVINQDPYFSGLVFYTNLQSLNFDFDSLETNYVQVTLDYEFQYRIIF